MELIMEHWLSFAVGIYLLAMVLHGHYRGFFRMAVTFGALVLSIAIVPMVMPLVTSFLKEHTGIHSMVRQSVLETAMGEEAGAVWQEHIQLPAQQRQVIENLQLPETIKKALVDNNNSEIYRILGVDTFFDYVATYLADMALNLAGAVVLFLAVFVGLRILVRWLDLVARLPVIHGINQIAGAILGGCQGMLYLWIACLVTDLCSKASWAQAILTQIQDSLWLCFLYQNNLLGWIFFSVLKRLT